MKYSVEVETDSRVYQSPGGSGYGTPTNGRGGTPSRQLNWAIEVDILTGEPIQVAMEKINMEKVTAESVSKRIAARAVNEPGKVKRVSRVEREEELIQRAMRKKSRKVSRQGDFVIFTEKQGVLTTQNGTQQIVERRIKLGSHDLEKLVELGY
eukprot:TRINITY_DN3409_c0_g1_i4.p1 TRINITY_DN3409_c0_g1~~TRINITY_DN3409_c0_g1_i4.p1  ORF type:complete len:153 (-),score=49.40 TRINITY_DN3409_c0_g1_i4:130-588(-)